MTILARLLVLLAVASLPSLPAAAPSPVEIPAADAPAPRVAERPDHAPGELIVKLEPGPSAGRAFVGVILDELGIGNRDVLPVFTAIHAARLQGRSESEVIRETIARLRERSPLRRFPTPPVARGLGDVYRVILDDDDVDVASLCARIEAHEAVRYAEPNMIVRAQLVPDDFYYHSSGSWGQGYDDLWGLKKIQSEGAWDRTTGDPNLIVAVVDSGIDYNHADLAQNIWINTGEIPHNDVDDDGNGFIDDVRGWDFCTFGGSTRDDDPMDDRGHGTHCAGTIAAVTDNAAGVAALSWRSRLMAVRGLNQSGTGYTSDLAEAIVYAADNGAAVINASWGGRSWAAPQVLRDAVDHAYDLGCVIVAAAGNDNADALMYYPANLEHVITVSAFNPYDVRASFSNWGVKIDVAAPGEDILSCLAAGSIFEQTLPDRIVGGNYLRLQGTSMAAPHVAGLAALILSAHPEFSSEQVRQVLRASADDVGSPGWDLDSGYGRINANQALQLESALTATISSPVHRDYLTGTVTIRGTAAGPDFRRYRVEYGAGTTPATWTLIEQSNREVLDDVLASWDTSDLDDGDYTLRVAAVDRDDAEFTDRVLLWKDTKIKNGWPVDVGGSVFSSAALHDIDGTPGMEVAVSTTPVTAGDLQGRYDALTHDGGDAPGQWPASVPYPAANSAAVGDLDLDGGAEVVGTCMGFRGLYAWRSDGTSMGPNFPVDVSRGRYISHFGGFISDNSPTLADLDGDPEWEIVMASHGVVWAVNHDGTPLAGWPVTLMTREGIIFDSPSVAVGDLDRDGLAEVVAYAGYEENDYPYTRHFYVHVLNHDGTPMEIGAWPVYTQLASALSSPTLGDLENDGDLEVLLGGAPATGCSDGDVHAWHHDGTPVANWPVVVRNQVLTDPVLADLDGDDRLEVLVVTSGHRLYAFRSDGGKVFERSMTVGGTAHPTAGDVDGDAAVEVVVGGYYGELHAWEVNGVAVSGWPRRTTDLISTSPALGDLDDDLLLDVVAGSRDHRVYAWNLGVPLNPFQMEWPTYRHDNLRSGLYTPPPPPCTAPPGEVSDLSVGSGPHTLLSWQGQTPGIRFDVVGGLTSELAGDGSTSGAGCLGRDLPDALWGDARPDPAGGQAYYYLVRARSFCGLGSYGTASNGTERLVGGDCP